MSTAESSRALRPPALPRAAGEPAASAGRPSAPRPGPVLMGDIHGARMGTPDLLLLWSRWEREAQHRED